jgi:hypothetical protein
VRASTRLQSLLGDVHDVDVVKASVERARALPEGGRGPLLSALNRVRAVRIAAFQNSMSAASGDQPESSVHASGTVSLRKTSTR